MDVGLQTGAIHEILLQVHGLLQAQLLGRLHRPFQEPVDHGPHLLGRQPMSKALHFALGGHPDLVQGIHQAEPLIEWIAGQLATEPAIILLQQRAQQRAAQGPARPLLELALLDGRDFSCRRRVPSCQGALDKLLLHSAVAQKSIDLFEA